MGEWLVAEADLFAQSTVESEVRSDLWLWN